MGKAGLPALLKAVRGRQQRAGGAVDERKAALADLGLPVPEAIGCIAALSVLGQFRESQAEVVPVLLDALDKPWLASNAASALGRLRPDDPRVKAALLRIRDGKITLSRNAEFRVAQHEMAQETRVMAAWALTQLPGR